MKRALLCDLKRSVCSPLFTAACIAYLILLLSTNGTVGDMKGSPQFALFQMLMQPDDQRWLTIDEYAWYRIWDRVIHGYSHMMLVTALMAVPAVVPFCDELSTGSWRFTVSRIGSRKWKTAHLLNAVLCALLVVLTGITVTALICAAAFPAGDAPFTDHLGTAVVTFPAILQYLAVNCVYLLMLIPAAAVFTLTCSALMLNAYSAICLPMVAQFLCKQLAWRKYRENSLHPRWLLLDTDTLARPEYTLPVMFTVHPTAVLIPAYICCLLLCGLLFWSITERRLRQ